MLDICLKKNVSSLLDLHDSPAWWPPLGRLICVVALRWQPGLFWGHAWRLDFSSLNPSQTRGGGCHSWRLASRKTQFFLFFFLCFFYVLKIFRINSKHFSVMKHVLKCGPYNTFSNVVLIDNSFQFLIFQKHFPKAKTEYTFWKFYQTRVKYCFLFYTRYLPKKRSTVSDSASWKIQIKFIFLIFADCHISYPSFRW